MAYKFLSEEWVAEARKIGDEYRGQIPQTSSNTMRMNLVIKDVPFGEGLVNAHMDNSEGDARMDMGHLDNPDVTITTDYETAKSVFIDSNPQAGMQAFMAGKVQIQGDMSKLMMGMQAPPDPKAQEMQAKIREITE